MRFPWCSTEISIPSNPEAENLVSTRPSDKIKQILDIYEKKYKTFASLGIRENIYETISNALLIKLNIDIETIYIHDKRSFMLIISAFYGRRNPLNIPENLSEIEISAIPEERNTLNLSKNALHTLLVMCFAARVMIKLLRENKMRSMKKMERYQEFKDELEDLACKLLDSFLLDNEYESELAFYALQLDYRSLYEVTEKSSEQKSPYQEYLCDKFEQSKEIMAIATKAKARKFLSQRSCLDLMEIRNKRKEREHVETDEQVINISSGAEVGCNKHKLAFHCILRAIYVVVFAHMLCRYPFYDNYNSFVYKQNLFCENDNNSSVNTSYFHIQTMLEKRMKNGSEKCLDMPNGYDNTACRPLAEQFYNFVNSSHNTSSDHISEVVEFCKRIVKCTAHKCSNFSTTLERACSDLCGHERRGYSASLNKIEAMSFAWVLLVLVSQLTTTISKAVDHVNFYGKGKFSKKLKVLKIFFDNNYLSLIRTMMITVLLVLEVFRLVKFSSQSELTHDKMWPGFWSLVPIVLELIYCTLFAIVVITSLRFFHFIPRLGFFVHLFKKMWKTVFMFVVIFSIIWIVLAVVHVSLSRTISHTTSTTLYTVISEGKFEVFGEVRDEDRNGILANCDQFNRTILDFSEMHYAEASCLFRRSIIPFLMFSYMFVTGILLVNLLTAQLTKEYENESESSEYYKGYLRYRQLAKIETKMFLPPPLSLLNFLVRLLSIPWPILNLCLEPLCLSISSPSLIWKMVEFLDGHPWRAVRKVAIITRDTNWCNEQLKAKYLHFDCELPSKLDRMKKLIDSLDQNPVNLDNLNDVRRSINSLMDKIRNGIEV